MSYSFYMATKVAPDFHALLAALPHDAIECDDIDFYPPLGEGFPEDVYFHFYLRGISTRAVEVGFHEGALQVRIMTCSCREDYELAFSFVKEVAATYDAMIEPEDREPLALAQFDFEFEGWVDEMVKSGATLLPRLIENPDFSTPLTLPGPRREFHFGERVSAELGDPDAPDFADRLFEKIRSVRYFDDDEFYYHANVMQIEYKESGETTSIAVWGPGVDYVFPKVEYLSLIADDLVHIPMSAAEKLTDVTYLDECQLIVNAIPDEEWESFLSRARAFAVSLDSSDKPASNGHSEPKKKWWQFGK